MDVLCFAGIVEVFFRYLKRANECGKTFQAEGTRCTDSKCKRMYKRESCFRNDVHMHKGKNVRNGRGEWKITLNLLSRVFD
jgi:hypothetical protein